MPRPSMKKERKEEILKAYERCIIKYGVGGATQKRVAEEAGIARPLLRHHLGNNDEMLMAVTKRYLERSRETFKEMVEYPYRDTDEFLQILFFMDVSEEDQHDSMIATGLIVAAQSDPRIREKMSVWFEEVNAGFLAVLKSLYPLVGEAQLSICSTGLIGIYFNMDTFAPIQTTEELKEKSYAAASLLLSSLDTEKEA